MRIAYKRIILGISVGVLCILSVGCQQNQPNSSGSSSSNKSSISSSVNSSASSSKNSASSSDISSTSSSGNSASSEKKVNDLSNAAMLGNSYLDGFDTYAVLPDMDCFYRIGLNVRTAFTKPMINKDIPVIDELNNDKQYDEVLLMFGENELGWPNEQAFLDGYSEVIDKVREYQPKAEIYIQSMLPVSKEVSDENKDGINNENIRERNEDLKKLAEEKDAKYLDVASIMTDENGNLPDGAATDGIHPSISYYKQWADFLKENITNEE